MPTPAAILSILVQANGVAAAARDLDRVDDAGKRAGKSTGAMAGMMKKAGGVMAGAFAVKEVVSGIQDLVSVATESQVSSQKMQTQLKALGISYASHAKQIDTVIQKHSALSGLDDEDLQDSFTNIVRVTGDVNEALRLNGLAADFARAKNMDVAKAGELVAKVAGGNVGVLGRYGIQVEKGASATEALALLQQKFAGQAKAYGETAAGAQERFGVALEGVKEALGTKLLPIVTNVTNAISTFVTNLSSGTGGAGSFGRTVLNVWEKVQGAFQQGVTFVRGLLDQHRDDIKNVNGAIRNIGIAIQWAWETIALPTIKRVLPAIQQYVKGAFDVIGGVIKTISSLLTGDFKGAWDGVKQIFKGYLTEIFGVLRAATAPMREIISQLGKAIVEAFKAKLEDFKQLGAGIVGKIAEGVRGALSAITGVAEWLKDKVVEAVERAFDIGSPSKVMMELGGHIASGLVKGIVGGDVMGFIKNHLGGVANIAGDVLGGLGGQLAGIFGGGGGGGGAGGSGQLRKWLTAALAITGQLTPANLAGLTKQALSESGGNPRAINLWDSNAAAGHPSKGLLQTIDSTFNAYKLPGMGDIWNPIHNAVAAIRYMLARYGHIVSTGHGYAKGTQGAAKGLAWVGENGPELVMFKGGEQVWSHLDSMRLAGYANGTGPTKGSGRVLTGTAPVGPVAQAAYVQAALDWMKANSTGPTKGVVRDLNAPGDPVPVAVVSEPASAAAENQALVDAIKELAALEQQRIDLTNVQLQQARAALNVSQSQYQQFRSWIAGIANAELGSTLGLGLSGMRAAPGSVARV